MSQTSRRVDLDAFRDWCEQQAEKSRDSTARLIVDGDDHIKFRIREHDEIEDIELIRSKGADVLRFTSDSGSRQFMSHRREFTFHDKTLIVRADTGEEICRAGTGTRNKKGAFPV